MQTWSRSCATPVVARDGGWARWPVSDDLKPEVRVTHLHTVSVTLADTTTDFDEMLLALGDALAHFRLRLTHDDQDRTILVLTVEASDLWLAVLLVMNAVTATGYVARTLAAEPATATDADPEG